MAVIRALLVSRTLWTLAGVALLWGLLGVAVRDLARDPRFDALPRLQGARGPAWGGDELMQPVVARLMALGPVNLFDPDFEQRVRIALAEVPGVAEVETVKKLWPRRYAVEMLFHRPVAVVAQQGRRFPVTAEGVVLPPAPYVRAVRGLLEISGVDAPPPPRGAVWTNPLLLDGIATLTQIAPHLEELAPLGLERVDVSEADDPRRGVRILGADGIVVRWGRPRAAVGENPVATKIAFLRIAAAHVSQVRGLEIDVRYDELFTRE